VNKLEGIIIAVIILLIGAIIIGILELYANVEPRSRGRRYRRR